MLYFLKSYQDMQTLNPRINCNSISKAEIVLGIYRQTEIIHLPTYILFVLFLISGCWHPAIFGETDRS